MRQQPLQQLDVALDRGAVEHAVPRGVRDLADAPRSDELRDEDVDALEALGPYRFGQRALVALVACGDIRAVLEEQADDLVGRRVSRRGHQRRVAQARARVDVGPGCDQEPYLLDVAGAPEQRRRARLVRGLGVGTVVEQVSDGRGVSPQRGDHQRGRAVGGAQVGRRSGAQESRHELVVAFADRAKQRVVEVRCRGDDRQRQGRDGSAENPA